MSIVNSDDCFLLTLYRENNSDITKVTSILVKGAIFI